MHYLRWSDEAIFCFERNMICKGCINEEFCTKYTKLNKSKRPPMKDIVFNLYQKLGNPIKKTKKCPKCGKEKSLEEFSGKNCYCKICFNIYQKERKKINEKLSNY